MRAFNHRLPSFAAALFGAAIALSTGYPSTAHARRCQQVSQKSHKRCIATCNNTYRECHAAISARLANLTTLSRKRKASYAQLAAQACLYQNASCLTSCHVQHQQRLVTCTQRCQRSCRQATESGDADDLKACYARQCQTPTPAKASVR